MRILLIGPDLEENLSLGYLAASLDQAGYTAELVSYNSEADITAVLNSLAGCEWVGISLTYQAKAREYLGLARLIKEQAPDIKIVAGGHYATCAAREILAHHPEIDTIVMHEGEDTLVELVTCLRRGENSLQTVKGIAYRKNDEVILTEPRRKIEDLDTLPYPRRSPRPYILAGVPTAYILGSRGCLNSCSYCCISTLHRYAPGKRFRQRRPEAVAAEMAELYHQRGVRHFVFHDDNFLVPRTDENLLRLTELKRQLRMHKVTDIGLTIKCCPSEVTESVFLPLKEMGLVRVFLGIESSADAIVSRFNRRQTICNAEEAIALCRRLGISVQFNIMVFNPCADFDSIQSDIAFMKKYSSYPLNFCRTEIFAGTPLEQEMLSQKRARGNYLARTYSMSTPALDRACGFFSRLFYQRCWAKSSLLLMTVSLEHLAAMLRHHYQGDEVRFICKRIHNFISRVNEDSLALLEQAVFLFEGDQDYRSPQFLKKLNSVVRREKHSYEYFILRGRRIEADIVRYVNIKLGIEETKQGAYTFNTRRNNLARHAMAVALAVSVTGFSCIRLLYGIGVSEYAPPPLEDTDSDGLYDKYENEIFNTDPELVDTDGDGIEDGDEDHDNDGITNKQYQSDNLSPYGY